MMKADSMKENVIMEKNTKEYLLSQLQESITPKTLSIYKVPTADDKTCPYFARYIALDENARIPR